MMLMKNKKRGKKNLVQNIIWVQCYQILFTWGYLGHLKQNITTHIAIDIWLNGPPWYFGHFNILNGRLQCSHLVIIKKGLHESLLEKFSKSKALIIDQKKWRRTSSFSKESKPFLPLPIFSSSQKPSVVWITDLE